MDQKVIAKVKELKIIVVLVNLYGRYLFISIIKIDGGLGINTKGNTSKQSFATKTKIVNTYEKDSTN